jgi:hypothetical protein
MSIRWAKCVRVFISLSPIFGVVLIQTAYRQPFAKMMWCPVKDAAMGGRGGKLPCRKISTKSISLRLMHSRNHQTSLWQLQYRKSYWRNAIASTSCERSKA